MSTCESDALSGIRGKIDSQRNIIVKTPTYQKNTYTLLEQALENEKRKQNFTDDVYIDMEVTQKAKDIAHSNQRLSDQQREVLNTVIAQRTAGIRARYLEIVRVQAKINSMVDDMKGLCGSLSKQEAEVDLYRAIIAPIRLLPPELLTRIFVFVLPDRVSPHLRSSPLGLSHVCSTWRNVALASRSLWSNLYIDAECIRTYTDVYESLILTWFGRAHPTAPLHFSLQNLVEPDHVFPVSDGVGPFLNRISQLEIDDNSFECFESLLQLTSARLPMLEILELQLYVNDWEKDLFTLAIDAPRLHTATLDLPSSVLKDSSTFPFPWGQLTTLHFPGGISVSAFSHIIWKCVHLQTASFSISPDYGEDRVFHYRGKREFPNLSNLKVELEGPKQHPYLGPTLDQMSLPALHTLYYAGNILGCSFSFNEVVLRRTMVHISVLRHLTLSCVAIDPGNFSTLLYACPLLESLALCMINATDIPILRFLRLGETGSESDIESRPTFPHLTSFKFTMHPEQFEDSEVAAEEFAGLVISWVQDPLRKCPLETVLLEVICRYSDKAQLEKSNAVLDGARQRLAPWTRAEEVNNRAGFHLDANLFFLDREN